MKILITGGAGFIDSHIAELYQDRAEEIRILDNLRIGYQHNLEGLRHTFIEGTVTDRELVRKAVEGIDYVIHMAALVSVPESMAKPGECVDINIHSLLNVLEEASAAGSKSKVVHAAERTGDVRHSRDSADKLRAAGWLPQHHLADGLANSLEDFRAKG